MPIDHVNIPVVDLAGSKTFYAAALAPIGYSLVYESDSSLGFGMGDGGDEDEPFAVRLEGEPTLPSHIAFTATSTSQVDALSRRRYRRGRPRQRSSGRTTVRRVLLRRVRARSGWS